MIKNLMTIRELCQMYGVSDSTLRTVLCRPDFASFFQGRLRMADSGSSRKTAYYYDCNGKFDRLLRKHLSGIKTYRKKLLS